MNETVVQSEWSMGRGVKTDAGWKASAGMAKAAPRLKPVDRQQMMLRAVDVEQLI